VWVCADCEYQVEVAGYAQQSIAHTHIARVAAAAHNTMALALLVTFVVAAAAAADDTRPLGPLHVPVHFYPRCPAQFGAVCRTDIDPVARIVRLAVGQPPWSRDLCLDMSGAADAITVFDDQAIESQTYAFASGGTDRVDLGELTLRLPFAAPSAMHSAPLAAADISPLCGGLFPLHRASPLWLYWANVTVGISSVLLGDSHRELGRLVGYDSPVLACDPFGAGLCTTEALVYGHRYRVVFDSGTQYTVVPPDLFERITVQRVHGADGGGGVVMPMVFPPEPADTTDCVRRYHALGFADTRRCGDGSGQYTLDVPLHEAADEDVGRHHQLLLRSADPAAARADADAHGGVSAIWLSVNVWRHVRVHVNHHRAEMVVHAHHIDNQMSTGSAVLVVLLLLAVATDQIVDTHLVWVHTHEVTAAIAAVVVLELGIVGASGYAVHASTTARALEDSAAWLHPALAATVWALNAVTLAVFAAFLFETAAAQRTLAWRATAWHPRLPSEFHATERLMLVRKFTVGTAGYVALWLLVLEGRHDTLGDGLAAAAAMFALYSVVLFMVRVITLEYHAMLTRQSHAPGRLLAPLAVCWALFLAVAAAASLFVVVVLTGVTVFPFVDTAVDAAGTSAVMASLALFVAVVVLVVLFADYNVMQYLAAYDKTLAYEAQVAAQPKPPPPR